jgi:cell division protein FtsL
MKKVEKKTKNKKLTSLILGLVLILSLVQLFISHRLATSGERVKEFEVRADQIKEENALLEEEVGQMGSLSRVSREAEKLGLVRTSSILYLTSQIPVALGR